MAAFPGFSNRALDFYRALEQDNTKQFWLAHKDGYESDVREPMQILVAEFEDEFGPATLMRPYRDVRFSNDKTPYKTYQAALLGSATGIGCYVQLDSSGLLAGGGFRSHSKQQVEGYRAAVNDDATGGELSEIVARLRENDFAIEGDQLKTIPRGYDRDHPRADLLRRTSVLAIRRFGAPAWLATPQALDQVREAWQQVTPLNEWVLAHVGDE